MTSSIDLDRLEACPFCGGEADIHQVGNEHTKTRGFEVKCTAWGCSTVKRAMVIRHTLEDARRFAIKRWNQRPTLSASRGSGVPEGWRPIETAPKSIGPVLLLVDGVVHQAVYQGPSDGAVYSKSPSIYNWFTESGQHSIADGQISGWQPLPAAPTPSGPS